VSAALRRHGTTLALVVLTAAVGVAVLVIDRGSVTTAESIVRRNNLLPVFRGDDVTEVRLTTGGRVARVFRGDADDAGQRPWQIEIEGVRYPAEEMAVDQLLGALRDGVVERRMERVDVAERTAYGLDAPRGEIAVNMGAQRWRVRLGGPAQARAGAIWVEIDGHGVAIITPQLAAAIEVAPESLRRRELVTWEASDLDALTIDGEGGPRHLVRAPWQVARGASFRFDGSTPEGKVRASAAGLDRVWEALGRMKADAFLTDAEADEAGAPAVTVVLTPHGGKPVTLTLGGECPDHPDDVLAVRREEGAARVTACVPEGVLAALSLPASELVDRHLLGARADEVVDVKLEEGGRSLTLARTGAQWHEQTPIDRPIEADVGRAFLERLLAVQVADVASAGSGDAGKLDPPRATVRVTSLLGDGRGERVELVELGAEEGGLIHVRRVEDGALATLPADAADALRPEETALRSRKALDVATTDFRSLRVTGPLGTQRYERHADGEWVLLEPHGEGLAPDAGLLTELAETVGGLAVERWVGAARPEQGLDRPRLVIAADVVSGKTTRAVEVALGAPTGSGTFARVSGDAAVFVASRRLEEAADRWLLDRSALVVDVEHLTRVTLAADGGKKLVLESRAGALHEAGAAPGAEDTGRTAAVRNALADLMADGVVSVGPPASAQGFDKPALRVTVELPGRQVDLRFGAGDAFRGDRVDYARRAGIGATFAVAQARVQPLLDAVR
jgi:Domain of unknown function (DUF4340)